MSFRDNMQHLRASRNMTQEQLAMLLGVSRQSVSKWEAERAYPEMDKLLRMCALFDCTLDELVCGDLTARPSDGTARVPAGKPQDVTGYDQAMRTFAWKLPLGIAVVMLGAALALLLSDPAFVPVPEVRNLATVTVFVGAAVGLALVLPASFERSAFRKEHPFVDDFYTADQRSQARSLMTTGLVVGAVLLMAGLAATIVLQADVWLAGAAFLVCAAAGAFVVVRGCLLGSRCNLARYNRRSLGGMSEEQIAAMGDDDL
ncbi:helix-turn-helix domain-containing protein, partial [Gordonibacter pamelaeae]